SACRTGQIPAGHSIRGSVPRASGGRRGPSDAIKRGFCHDRGMTRLEGMTSSTMVARPGPLLFGTTIFGLSVWLGVLLLLPWVKGIGMGTYLSAVLMALLFATLLLGHLSTEIQFRSDGIA